MGYFRRYKLSDYTAEECREGMNQCLYEIRSACDDDEIMERYMEEWACLRELLARHEGKNKSQLDKNERR